uniref:Uncharacterized protein n=1 Tax=Sphaerodactylus townsendi TaxID=933632 RepID=A0ACB8GBB7_9SAUR
MPLLKLELKPWLRLHQELAPQWEQSQQQELRPLSKLCQGGLRAEPKLKLGLVLAVLFVWVPQRLQSNIDGTPSWVRSNGVASGVEAAVPADFIPSVATIPDTVCCNVHLIFAQSMEKGEDVTYGKAYL